MSTEPKGRFMVGLEAWSVKVVRSRITVWLPLAGPAARWINSDGGSPCDRRRSHGCARSSTGTVPSLTGLLRHPPVDSNDQASDSGCRRSGERDTLRRDSRTSGGQGALRDHRRRLVGSALVYPDADQSSLLPGAARAAEYAFRSRRERSQTRRAAPHSA